MLIAFCGPIGSGKSTVADALVERYGYVKMSFAEPLKGMLGHFLKMQGASNTLVERMLNGDLKEEPTFYLGGRTPRYAMQKLGTEWRDMMSTTLWLDAWDRRYHAQSYPRVIVDDLRFQHEFYRIKLLGGYVHRVARPGCEPGEHISERDFLGFDGISSTLHNNNKTLEECQKDLLMQVERWAARERINGF